MTRNSVAALAILALMFASAAVAQGIFRGPGSGTKLMPILIAPVATGACGNAQTVYSDACNLPFH